MVFEKYFFYGLILVMCASSCHSQTVDRSDRMVGGGCDGCEAVYEYGKVKLNNVDTLPGFDESDLKIKIEGTVFKKDGKTPAEGVILYIYHTNRDGLYIANPDDENSKYGHGKYRGWIKTGKNGKYTFFTFRPAAYPNGTEAEHIHIMIKEPNVNEYYLDNYTFTDDPLLTKSKIDNHDNRGGSGVSELIESYNMKLIKRDIILGLNIPNY